jgi:hypothetical protein
MGRGRIMPARMSNLLVGQVLNLDLPIHEKLVLVVMADPAHDDGTSSFLAMPTIARKSSTTVRGAQKIIRRLEQARYVKFVGKIHVATRRRVANWGHGITPEYKLTLDLGDSAALHQLKCSRRVNHVRGSELSQTPNGETRNPELCSLKTPNGEARNPEPHSGEPKVLTIERNECGSRVEENRTAAAAQPSLPFPEARDAFRVLGFEGRFGRPNFQAIWATHYVASQREGIWLTQAMEACIQECQDRGIGIPPQFYEAKRDVEAKDKAEFERRYRGAVL